MADSFGVLADTIEVVIAVIMIIGGIYLTYAVQKWADRAGELGPGEEFEHRHDESAILDVNRDLMRLRRLDGRNVGRDLAGVGIGRWHRRVVLDVARHLDERHALELRDHHADLDPVLCRDAARDDVADDDARCDADEARSPGLEADTAIESPEQQGCPACREEGRREDEREAASKRGIDPQIHAADTSRGGVGLDVRESPERPPGMDLLAGRSSDGHRPTYGCVTLANPCADGRPGGTPSAPPLQGVVEPTGTAVRRDARVAMTTAPTMKTADPSRNGPGIPPSSTTPAPSAGPMMPAA